MAARFSIFSEISAIYKGAQVVRQVMRDLRPLARQAKEIGRAWGGAYRAGQVFGRELRNVALAATVAAGAAFGVAQQSAAAAEGVVNAADKLGIGAERYQELRFAADQAKVGANNLETGLQRLNRRIVDAAGGKNQAVASLFAKLGISMRDANGELRTSADLLPELADGFAANENAAVRTAMAFALFDTEGVDFVRLLGSGSAGLAAMSAEARRTGSVVREDLLRAAAEFDDRFSSLISTIKALAIEITGRLSPAMGEGTAGIQEFIAANRADIVEGVVSAIRAVAAAARGVGTAVQVVLPIIQSMVEFMGGWENAGIALAALFGAKLVLAFAAFTQAVIVAGIALVANPIGAVVAGVVALVAGLALLIVKWDEWKAAIARFTPHARLLVAIVETIRENWEAITAFAADPLGGIGDAIKGFFGAGGPSQPAPTLADSGSSPAAGRMAGELKITVEGPRGTRIETGPTDNLDIETETGLSLAGAGAGG